MAGRRIVLVLAVCAAAFSAAAATAAPGDPDVSQMTLRAADFPSGAAERGGAVDTGSTLVSAYERTIFLANPYGSSHYRAVFSIAELAPGADVAAEAYAAIGHQYSSKAGRVAIVKEFTKGLKVTAKQITMIKPRGLGVSDSSMEIGFVVKTKTKKINLSVTLLRLDRVLVEDVAVGSGTSIAVADGLALTKLAAGHVSAALVPIDVSPPTITGTAVQGQTLTAAPGGWGDSPTAYAYQWQRCDATGANCADVAGASASTYAVTSADVGATLRVNVTATNRFGSVVVPSAATAAVT
jgi:hypothetical protein